MCTAASLLWSLLWPNLWHNIYMRTFICMCLRVVRVYHFRYQVCVCSFQWLNTGQQSLGRLSCDSTTRLRSIRPKMPLSTIQVFDLCAGSFAAISSFVWTAAELSLLLLGLSLGHHWSHQSPSRPVWALMAFTHFQSVNILSYIQWELGTKTLQRYLWKLW